MNDSVHYLQAQSLAQVAVQVAHKEATGRVRTALPTLPCRCHQNGTRSLVERKKFNFIYHIPEMYFFFLMHQHRSIEIAI